MAQTEDRSSINSHGEIGAETDIEMTIPSSLKFLISTIKTVSNNPLTTDNYLTWSSQILKLFRANGYLGFLDGTQEIPNRNQPSDALRKWELVDQNLAAVLCSTISPAILPYVLNLETAQDIWITLSRRFQSTSRSKVIQLRNQLHHLVMKDRPMQTYLSEIKQIVDQLSAAGASVDQEDIILYTLNGLPPTYQAFKTAIRTRATPLSLDELYALLCSEEINHQAEQLSLLQLQNTALIATQNRGGRSTYRGKGRNSPNKGKSSQSPTNSSSRSKESNFSPTNCQICGKYGHSAQVCWHRTNLEFRPTNQSHQNQQALLSAGMTMNHPEDWILDSGATAHLTPHYSNLSQPSPYQGSDHVSVGNDASLPITHTVQGILPTPSRSSAGDS